MMSAEADNLSSDPGPIESQEHLGHYSPQISDHFSVRVPVRNETYEDAHSDELNNPLESAEVPEHLLRSGPLGRCNDPYCTTCQTYLADYRVSTPPQSSSVRSALFGGARNVQSRIQVWREGWLSVVLNPHTRVVQKWNKFFVISCLVAIFLDPLFFLLFSVRQNYLCITFNATFAKVVTVLRSITDLIYFLHMLLQFKLAYVAPTEKLGRVELVDKPKEIANNYLKGFFILDVFAVLPLPQIMIWLVVPHFQGRDANANFVKNILRVTVLLQYVPRCIRFLPLVAGHSGDGFAFDNAWANFGINIFIYLLAGHVVGACWYLFGLQRVNECLHTTCASELPLCKFSYLDCGNGRYIGAMVAEDPHRSQWLNSSSASSICLGSNISFVYGIYSTAVPVTTNGNILSKYLYSLFWGFLQISTFAGNLTPSVFIWEVLFTMGVTGLGLLLFALLIGNMQNFLQSLGRRQMDMQLQRYNIEIWMKLRNLPVDLRRKVRQAERLKWVITGGVDENELLEGLPEDLYREIRRELALGYIKKVRVFQVMEDIVLNAICEHLHQKLYIEKSKIQQIGYPVHQMLFIVRGRMRITGDNGSEAGLHDGEFCGEELLQWFLDRAAVHPGNRGAVRPTNALSSREVECLTNVEAFSLEAVDLEFVVDHFNSFMRHPRVQGAIKYESLYFRTLAARTIQTVWRYRKKRLKRFQSMQRTINGISTSRGSMLNHHQQDFQAW